MGNHQMLSGANGCAAHTSCRVLTLSLTTCSLFVLFTNWRCLCPPPICTISRLHAEHFVLSPYAMMVILPSHAYSIVNGRELLRLRSETSITWHVTIVTSWLPYSVHTANPHVAGISHDSHLARALSLALVSTRRNQERVQALLSHKRV
jgi:hypothetical protein